MDNTLLNDILIVSLYSYWQWKTVCNYLEPLSWLDKPQTKTKGTTYQMQVCC